MWSIILHLMPPGIWNLQKKNSYDISKCNWLRWINLKWTWNLKLSGWVVLFLYFDDLEMQYFKIHYTVFKVQLKLFFQNQDDNLKNSDEFMCTSLYTCVYVHIYILNFFLLFSKYLRYGKKKQSIDQWRQFNPPR